jgi:hypothetical protein
MKTVHILDDDDILMETDFCRPLFRSADFSSTSDTWVERNQYSGCPEDHLKWAHVFNCIGPTWYGKRISAAGFHSRMEFARGDIPESHILKGKFPDFR